MKDGSYKAWRVQLMIVVIKHDEYNELLYF
jgi:hypothetical protein